MAEGARTTHPSARPPPALGLLALLLAAGCVTEPPCPKAALPPGHGDAALAVVTGDYFSTAIALISADGTLIDEAWVDSGSAEAGIVAALSGDVVLPSEPLGDRELAVIDRFGVDVVSHFDLDAGSVLAQRPTQLEATAGAAGYRANPQDALLLPDGSLLVSRLEPNYDPAAPELDRGNDLVIVDDAGPTERISLSALDAQPDGPEGTRFYARPSRMTRLGTRVIVGLARLDRSFMFAGPGAVALVDVEARTATALPLPGLSNCGELRGTPSGDAAIVLCAGATFGTDDATRRATAGLARIVLGPDGPLIAEIVRADDDAAMPTPSGTPMPLGGTVVAYVSTPVPTSRDPDRLVVFDLATGAHALAHTADGSFRLGAGRFVPSSGRLLLPDATTGILRFAVRGSALELLGTTVVSPCRGLPALEVSALSP